ncbi:hypothetical protein [Nonomuraea dietziae]|uniref:hypothetical protein n=1 Tax=Nonomuraea dietziae TaxID=65515 RepID=UPI0031D2A750
MSDGHETPPGWSAEQPPPYRAPGSPYSGGPDPSAWQQPVPPPPPYGQQGYGYMPPPALRPGIIPLRPLGLGDIYDGTIKLIRSNPKAVLGLSAIVAGRRRGARLDRAGADAQLDRRPPGRPRRPQPAAMEGGFVTPYLPDEHLVGGEASRPSTNPDPAMPHQNPRAEPSSAARSPQARPGG